LFAFSVFPDGVVVVFPFVLSLSKHEDFFKLYFF